MANKYDIFISYRRDGGAQYARILQLMLTQRGYKVFLDYDELTDGIFSDHIKAAIKDAPVFMLVLSNGALKRCVNEDDWVRREILLAVQHNKHFVPVNPDNKFDGVPAGIPQEIATVAGSHQQSEIGFGQTLGVTIDLMIKNRLVPKIGSRSQASHMDVDFDAAKETLKKIDARNKFIKRATVAGVIAVILIVASACYLFFKHTSDTEAINNLRTEIQEKHQELGLNLSPDLTESQILTIDEILTNMHVVTDDSLWIGKYEFTVGQWYGILKLDYDVALKDMPMTGMSYGEINMHFLDSLRNMTNIEFDLPSAEEWEYAARGGAKNEAFTYVGGNDVDAVAWYKNNSGGKAHPSNGHTGKDPNGIDLFDMSGNVAEICNSPIVSEKGEMKWTACGGDYNSEATGVTVTSRRPISTDEKSKTLGFRLIVRK